MYIRRTKTRNASTGESYHSHRLVESKRLGNKVRQVTLLNLGRHFSIAQEQWPTLCARVEQLLRVQTSLLEVKCSVKVEREAQRIVSQLLARQSDQVSIGQDHEENEAHHQIGKDRVSDTQPGVEIQDRVESVIVDSLESVRPRTVGVEHAALSAMNQVGFIDLLEETGFTGPQRMAAVGSIIGRMANPGSERATYQWLATRSALGELLDMDFEAMSMMQLDRVSDLLVRNQEAIEKGLFDRLHDLFGFSCTVTLYDLTNTFLEGATKDNPKAQRGHSKEKKSDCPLLTMGLMLDGSGFVRRSRYFAGNIAEAKTLEQMLQGLDAPKEAMVVMDRGMATEANLSWLRDQGYRYLVVSRKRNHPFDPEQAMCIETASKELVYVRKVVDPDGREVRLYCRSERRAQKEEEISRRFTERLESGLQKLSDGLSKPKTIKSIDKIWERIGRLKEKSCGVGQHYHIEVIPDEDGQTAKTISWKQKPVEGSQLTHPRVYCLRSNETTWDEKTLWRTYIRLTDVEAVIRSCKSEPGMRPVFHQKEERSDGHLFITILAYQFVQIIRGRLNEKGISGHWETLRKILSGQLRITTTFRRSDGRALHIRKTTRAEQDQRVIYQSLGINMSPGGVKKMVV
ncbi:MAG: IS1634 family transposase [Magnetococcales bacterium]|nr:IS1634 family transposase [Magnetococcales bacterium]